MVLRRLKQEGWRRVDHRRNVTVDRAAMGLVALLLLLLGPLLALLRLTRLLLRLFTPGARLRFGLFDGGN